MAWFRSGRSALWQTLALSLMGCSDMQRPPPIAQGGSGAGAPPIVEAGGHAGTAQGGSMMENDFGGTLSGGGTDPGGVANGGTRSVGDSGDFDSGGSFSSGGTFPSGGSP